MKIALGVTFINSKKFKDFIMSLHNKYGDPKGYDYQKRIDRAKSKYKAIIGFKFKPHSYYYIAFDLNYKPVILKHPTLIIN